MVRKETEAASLQVSHTAGTVSILKVVGRKRQESKSQVSIPKSRILFHIIHRSLVVLKPLLS